nr:DUF4097 family beta strand repeat-containing protein [uncultured Faecalimonas sp.]
MKKGWKIGWIIAGIAAASGGVFCIAGVALGARLDRINVRGDRVFHFLSGEMEEVSELDPADDSYQEDDTGAGSGDHFSDVRQIEIEMSIGDVIIEETDGKEVEAEIPDDFRKIQCRQDGVKLTIENTERRSRLGQDVEPVVIGIPKGTILEAFQCEIAAGEFTADTIHASGIQISAGAGDVTIGQLKAAMMNLETGTGEIDIVQADVTGADIECGMGDISLTLAGRETDYECVTECGLGSVWIGDEEYTALGSEKHLHKGAEKKLHIECGAGEIFIDFLQEE